MNNDEQRIEVEMEVTNQNRIYTPTGNISPLGENQPSRGKVHACKASQRGYQQACDRLKRAERDLAETTAFIAAALTTVTAVQAAKEEDAMPVTQS